MRLPLAAALAAALALMAFTPARADLLIQIDKAAQQMTVTADGELLYTWPVSTGIARYDTPDGAFTPFRKEKEHYSREWDDAPMPYSIFFTQKGHAIHGTNHRSLGRPASHGCVRLSVAHAAVLWDLVAKHKMANTMIVLTGRIPASDAPVVAQQRSGLDRRRRRVPMRARCAARRRLVSRAAAVLLLPRGLLPAARPVRRLPVRLVSRKGFAANQGEAAELVLRLRFIKSAQSGGLSCRNPANAAASARRAKPGARGKGGFFHIQVRPRTEFVFFRNQDVGRRGGIERVAGRRANGSWDTQKWLIGKTEAHRAGKQLAPDTAAARKVLKQLGSTAAPSRRRSLHRQAAAQDPGERKADAGDAARATRQHQEGAGRAAQAAGARMIRKLGDAQVPALFAQSKSAHRAAAQSGDV